MRGENFGILLYSVPGIEVKKGNEDVEVVFVRIESTKYNSVPESKKKNFNPWKGYVH